MLFLLESIFREKEEIEDAIITAQDRSLRTQLSNSDVEESYKGNGAEVRFHSVLPKKTILISSLVSYFATKIFYLLMENV